MPKVKVGEINLYYEEFGEGPPAVLVSGLGNDHNMWSFQVEELAKKYRVIVFDNRGIGRSDKPAGPYSTQQMAADTDGLIQALGLGPVHLIGFSMGSLISQWVAIKSPKLVRTLILIASYGKGGNFGVQLGSVWREIAINVGLDLLIREKALWVFSRRCVDHRAKEFKWFKYFYGISQLTVDAYVAQNLACVEHDASEDLHLIQAPSLIISSPQDRITSAEYQEYLYDNIPNSKLVWVEDSCHGLLWEDAERINAIIMDFLPSAE